MTGLRFAYLLFAMREVNGYSYDVGSESQQPPHTFHFSLVSLTTTIYTSMHRIMSWPDLIQNHLHQIVTLHQILAERGNTQTNHRLSSLRKYWIHHLGDG